MPPIYTGTNNTLGAYRRSAKPDFPNEKPRLLFWNGCSRDSEFVSNLAKGVNGYEFNRG